MRYTLLGKKVGMSQVYDGDNALVPVTVIEAGPCPVTQVKTSDSDGYDAIQIGFGRRKASRTTKPAAGHFKKAGTDPCQRLKEVRCDGGAGRAVGDVLTVEGFAEGQRVDVVGTTRGRGFQGVVKRFGFSGGPASHGSMFHRRGGSFGQCQWPGEVHKGRKMPGQMGAVQRTVQNLTVVKGSIPGADGSPVLVRTSKKVRRSA